MRKKCLSCFLIILLAVQSIVLLSSCSEEPDLVPENDSQESVFQKSESGYHIYGNYVYWRASNNEIYRYDLETFTRRSACLDAECEGDCILHEAKGISGIQNWKLFFNTEATDIEYDEYHRPISSTKRVHYAYQDLHTGEITVLRTCIGSEIDESVNSGVVLGDSHIYYTVNLLKKDGDPLNANDYIPTYCRMPIDGGEEEVLFPKTGQTETILMPYENELIVYRDQVICAYRIDTGEFREIYNYENTEFLMKPHTLGYGNGKMYFLGKVGNLLAEKGETYYNCALVELDLKTGAYRKIIDEKVFAYTVDEDGIYYIKTEYNKFLVEGYENVEVSGWAGDSVYKCDFDGNNETLFYKNSQMRISVPWFLIAGDSIYTQIRYSGTVRQFSSADGSSYYQCGMGFRKIDLASGKIIDPIIPEED